MDVDTVPETESTENDALTDIPDIPGPLQETAASVEIVDTSPTIFSESRTALRCAMKYCYNYQGKPGMSPYTTFYPFPKSAEIRAKWVALCNPEKCLDTNNARVCSNHFFLPGDFFFIGDEKHLAQHAIPTANLVRKQQVRKFRHRCAVMYCSSHKDLSRKVIHHKFPKSWEIRDKWIRLCRRKDKTTWEYAHICSDHFTPDDYRKLLNTDRERLKDDAVPSRFDCMPIAYRPSCAIKKFRPPPKKREFIPKIVLEPAVKPEPAPAPTKPKFITVMQFKHPDVDPCSLFTNSSPYLLTEVPTFCHGCRQILEGPCVLHGKRIQDPPYSRSSLPADLVLRRVDLMDETKFEVVEGVFAVKQIPKFTVFGPLVAPLESVEKEPSSKFGIKTDAGWQEYCLDSDYTCNWLKNVRFAKAKNEQNLMAYQQNGHVYFSTLDVIEPGSELKVWYARGYGDSRCAPDLVTKRPDITVGNSEFLSSTLPSSEDLEQANNPLVYQPPVVQNMILNTGGNVEKIDEILSVFTESLKGIRENVSELILEVNAAPESHEGLDSSPIDYPDDVISSYEELPDDPLPDADDDMTENQKTIEPEVESYTYDHQCFICDARFRTLNLLQIHVISHGKLSRKLNAENFACPDDLCKEPPFESMAELLRHVEQHKCRYPPTETFPCPHCVDPGRKYSTQVKLDAHVKEAHNSDGTSKALPGNLKAFQCDICFRSFRSEKFLGIHRETGHGLVSAGSHQCPVCLGSFDTNVELMQHGRSHEVDGMYTCRICRKNYDHFHALRRHMVENHGPNQKIMECAICGHTTNRSEDLTKHMAVHSSEYKYACDQCDRKFRFRSQVGTHKASWHDPANPPRFKAKPWKGPKVRDYMSYVFKCHDCKLGFSERKLLVRHLDARHPAVSKFSIPELNYPFEPVYKYPCPKRACRKRFDDEDQCREHLKTDHGVTDLSNVTLPGKRVHLKWYTCDKCDYRNTVLLQYHHHVQTAHLESSSPDSV